MIAIFRSFIILIIIISSAGFLMDPSPFIFEELGPMAHDSSYAHIIIEFNLSSVFDNHREIVAEFKNFSAATSNASGHVQHYAALFHQTVAKLAFSVDISSRILNELCVYIRCAEPPFDYLIESAKRPRRQAAALGIFGSIFNFGLSIYEETQIQALIEESKAAERRTKAIIETVQQHTRAINHNAAVLRRLKADFLTTAAGLYEEQKMAASLIALSTFLNGHAIEVEKLEMSIITLSTGRLPPSLIRPSSIFMAYNEAVKRAANEGYKTIIPPTSALFESKVSTTKEGENFTIVLHVPIAKDEGFSLFRLINFPFAVTNSSAAVVDPDAEYIAIDREHRRHIKLTSSEFLQCQALKGTRLCPASSVTLGSLAHSCIGAVFNSNAVAMRKRCRIRLIPIDKPKAVAVASCAWKLLVPPTGAALIISCLNGHRRVSSIAGAVDVRLNDSCRASCGDIALFCPRTFTVRSSSLLEIPSRLPHTIINDLFDGDASALDAIVDGWFQNHDETTEALSLSSASFMAAQRIWSRPEFIGSSTFAAIFLLSCIAAGGFCWFRRRAVSAPGMTSSPSQLMQQQTTAPFIQNAKPSANTPAFSMAAAANGNS